MHLHPSVPLWILPQGAELCLAPVFCPVALSYLQLNPISCTLGGVSALFFLVWIHWSHSTPTQGSAKTSLSFFQSPLYHCSFPCARENVLSRRHPTRKSGVGAGIKAPNEKPQKSGKSSVGQEHVPSLLMFSFPWLPLGSKVLAQLLHHPGKSWIRTKRGKGSACLHSLLADLPS